MMDMEMIPVLSALWLGILTSITPCPLATNIAATTYIGKQINTAYGTIVAGLFYTIGRTITYVLITAVVVSGLLSVPEISFFLQRHMNRILGPLLILTGLFIADVLSLKVPGLSLSQKLQTRLSNSGVAGALALGFLFALSFCPVSAALFFGSVIPLSLKFGSRVLFPSVFGVGTAIPVLVFAAVIAYSSRFAGRFFNRVAAAELYLRRFTGVLFILIGAYFCLKYIFGVINF